MTVLDQFDLDGRVALVTGAASGIGEAYATAMAEAGAAVTMVDIDADGLETAAASIADRTGAEVRPIVADVTAETENERIVDETVDAFGGLDVAFANAGIADSAAFVSSYEMADWDDVMDVNIRGQFMTAKAAVPAMRADDGGSIIHTASVLGLVGTELPGQHAYTASKGATIQVTKNLAAELGPLGIRVNAIAPGWVHTNIADGLLAGDEETRQAIFEEIEAETALKRLAEPADLKGLAVFLASEASAYCTGGTYLVDGGMLAT